MATYMTDNNDINAGTSQLNRWLEELVERGGSDLLLVAGAPASIRREGEVSPLEPGMLTGPEIEAAVVAVLTPHAREQYQATGIADSSYRLGSAGRFRINLHRQKGEAAAAIRALPSQVPSLPELNLPAGLESLAHLHHGLVLVGGPAGSGKSTTLAA